MATYEIKDWMNNLLFDGKTFESFQDGWSFIYDNVKDENDAYDDLFVLPQSV